MYIIYYNTIYIYNIIIYYSPRAGLVTVNLLLLLIILLSSLLLLLLSLLCTTMYYAMMYYDIPSDMMYGQFP